MPHKFSAIMAGLGSGILVAVMTRLNASLGQKIGVLEASFVVHLVGTLLALVIVFRHFNAAFVKNCRALPKHLFLGGILGVLIVVVVSMTVPILGMVVTMSLLVTADLIFCAVADHFGIFGLTRFPLTGRRVLGLIAAGAGLALIFWR